MNGIHYDLICLAPSLTRSQEQPLPEARTKCPPFTDLKSTLGCVGSVSGFCCVQTSYMARKATKLNNMWHSRHANIEPHSLIMSVVASFVESRC